MNDPKADAPETKVTPNATPEAKAVPNNAAPEAPAAPRGKPSRPISIQLAPSQVAFTPPLVECLAIVSRLHGKPITVTALEAGLPRTQEGLTPYACIRAARREGIDARIVHKPAIHKISTLNLPCILLTNDGGACVLTSIEGDKARIVMPENPEAPFETPLETPREN